MGKNLELIRSINGHKFNAYNLSINPGRVKELARKRTQYIALEVCRDSYELSLKDALALAYAQGLNDAAELS